MKRFYCTVCKKVKRVQKLPINAVLSDQPENRIGFCNKHSVNHKLIKRLGVK